MVDVFPDQLVNISPFSPPVWAGQLLGEDIFKQGYSRRFTTISNTAAAEDLGEAGEEFLELTQRVYGWDADFHDGLADTAVDVPYNVEHRVELFQSSAGAQLVLSNYSICARANYVQIDSDFSVGDMTISCRWEGSDPEGQQRAAFLIEFTYRNLYNAVFIWDSPDRVSLEYAQLVADIVLAKQLALPLSTEVLYSPLD